MHTLRELMVHRRVLDLGPLPAPRLAPNVTLHQALTYLVRGRRGAVVVVESERPVGIFTERDIVYRLSTDALVAPESRRSTLLGEVMSRPLGTVRRQATLQEALALMSARRHRHLVVVDRQGVLRGLLTSQDLVQYLTDSFPEHTVNLPPRLRQRYDTPAGA